jgi:flagellar basal body-associated protein FliL
MFILIWIIIVMFLLGFVAISEYNIAKQDEEWMNELQNKKRNRKE